MQLRSLLLALLLIVVSACSGSGSSSGANDNGDTGLNNPDTGVVADTGVVPDTGVTPDTGMAPDTGVDAGPIGECNTNSDCTRHSQIPYCLVKSDPADNECVECLRNSHCDYPLFCLNNTCDSYDR